MNIMNYPLLAGCFLISMNILLSACQVTDSTDEPSKQISEQKNIDESLNIAHTLKGRSDGKGYDLVFVADGFTQDEMVYFREAVNNYRTFSEQYERVFAGQQNAWNIHLVQIPSNESGVDEPKSGILKDTAFDSSFECEWVDRIICVNQEKVLDTVSEYFPQYDTILVLANSTRNGGASLGNNIITSSMNPNLNNTIIHELGHGLANLGDEYTYGGVNLPAIEPSQPNLTLNNDSDSVKWRHWFEDEDASVINIFEGGNYLPSGVWRPSENSVMRTLGQPFEAVNLEAWSLALYKHSGTYYQALPDTGSVNQTGPTQQFEIELALGCELQNIEWRINDVVVQANPPNLLTVSDQQKSYVVQASIVDNSQVIRKDSRHVSQDTLTWWVSLH